MFRLHKNHYQNIFGMIRRFCCEEKPNRKGVILGVYENDDQEPYFTPTAEKFNQSVNGKIMDLIKMSKTKFTLGKGQLFNNIDNNYWAVAVVGLGKEGQGYHELEAIHVGMESARIGAAVGAQLLKKEGCVEIFTEDLGFNEGAAEGAVLALWRYQEFKDPKDWKVIPSIAPFEDQGSNEDFQRGVFKAESQNLARRYCDMPANHMTPLRFAQEIVDLLCPCGIRVDVRDREWAESRKFNGFMAVAQGSCEPPVILEINYCGGPEEQKPIVLCGKGITYDSGGVCIKKIKGMSKYRGDLSGAACIVGAIRTASALNLPINITAIIPVCENMVSGMAMKCGDIINAMNGKSIMITDTDNEGRLCLADALVYAQHAYKPRLIIDVASLTPGSGFAFGSACTSVYTNSQTMWKQTRKAGIFTGDRVWRMPLWKYYTHKVTMFKSHDVDNKGKGKASSPLGAAFLNEFVTCVDWIHFDTAGVGFDAKDKIYPYYTKGLMTGRPTRTLIQLLFQLACPEEGAREIS